MFAKTIVMLGYFDVNADMVLHINDKTQITALQKEFHKVFPFLKIEFFNKKHKSGEALSKQFMFNNDITLGQARTIHVEGDLVINPEMLVNELEDTFSHKFGLSVQVFRKSGNVWLETTRTDSWSLKQQNEEGASIGQHFKNNDNEDFDYHEQE